MKLRKAAAGMMILGLSLAALTGCGGSDKEASGAGEGGMPSELNVQFVPTNNDGSMQAKAKPFADYLSDKLGTTVNVTLATDYSTIV